MAHNHSHADHARSFTTSFAIAMTVTLLYTATEASYALYANSTSLLADAAHNFGDSLGLGLAWLANWLLTFPAKKRYSYGFKRTTIIAALSNACILIATSALIGYEAIYKLFHLTSVDETIVIIIGLIGIVVNGGSSLLFMRGAHDDLNIKGAFIHLLADAFILLGVVISAIVIRYTHWLWIDPIVGLLIVGIVLFGTWGLLRDSISMMLDAVPRYIDQNGVKEYLENYPGVTAVHDLHIWGLSTRETALTAHLTMPTTTLADEDYLTINHLLHEKFRINHVTIQVERDSISCQRIDNC